MTHISAKPEKKRFHDELLDILSRQGSALVLFVSIIMLSIIALSASVSMPRVERAECEQARV